MNKIISLLILAIVFLGNSVFSQNVGIGTTSPTNTLHVIISPTNPNPNPVRFEGIQRYTNEDSVLVVNPSTGVIKYMPMADVLANLPSNILDSLILNSVINNTDTIYNNQSVRDSIITIALSNSDTLFSTQTFRDSVLATILSNMDTIFTITRDSLLTDSTFVNALRDSINTDDQNIDSLTIHGTILTTYIEDGASASVNVSNMLDSVILSKSDTLYSIISDSLNNDTTWITQLDSLLSIYGDTIYFNDSTYTLIKDSLLNDTAWLSELQDSINTDDQNIDSVTIHGTIITTYIEDGTSASVNVSNMLDSVILSKSDTLYSIISDSLNNDTTWIKQLDSLLSIYGDTIYFNDSSYTLVRDSLLNDSLFLDSLISLLGDSINTDDQNIDSVTIHGTIITTYIEDGTSASVNVSNMLDSVILSKSDTLYSIISDSLTNDTNWIKQIDSLLSIYGDTIYFNDSTYTLIKDSLLNDTAWLSELQDSINTDDQNIDSLTITGTILTTYIEGGTSASVNVSSMLDSVIFSKLDTLYSIISDSLTKDTNWIKQVDSLLSIYGDTIYFNDSTYVLVRDSLLGDTLFIDSLYSIISDSLLNDTLWIDSLGKLLNDNDWNINANGTGLEAAPAGDNVASGAYSIAAGQSDTATGINSVIAGGLNNKTSGSYAVVTGGRENLAIGSYSISGGYRDTAQGYASGVLSGYQNKTTGSYSSITGGYQNKTGGNYSTAGGYRSYIENSNYSISIGYLDSIFGAGNYSTLIGGEDNKILSLTGRANTIVGGLGNEMIEFGSYLRGASMFGGNANRIISTATLSFDRESTIIGGARDTIIDAHQGVIIGGLDNKLEASIRAGIFAGRENKLLASDRATMLGGYVNQINSGSTGSSILGGDSNTINNSANLATIIGGRGNVANNFGQTVFGHYSTNTVPAGSSSSAINPDNILLKIGNGTNPSNLNDAMVVKANGNVGVNTSNPTNQLHITGGTDPLRLEGLQYGGTTDSVLVTDANGVVKLASASSIASTKNFVSISSTYTVASNVDVVLADLSASSYTVTLPNPSTNSGRVIKVKRIDDATSTFGLSFSSPSGTIDGVVSPTGPFTVGYQGYEFMSDGTNWWILTRY